MHVLTIVHLNVRCVEIGFCWCDRCVKGGSEYNFNIELLKMDKIKRKAFERLKELYEEGQTLTYSDYNTRKFDEWRLNTDTALRRLSENQTFTERFNKIKYWPMLMAGGSNEVGERHRASQSGIRSAQALISTVIREIEDYEDIEEDDSIHDKAVEQSIAKGSRRIFIVHGHDEEMKQTVARFIEGIRFEAVILHEQASRGATIIEKIEANADVCYAIVLLSPDDVGAKAGHEDKLQPRARQNVILELGYFIGRLGRSHVCAIKRGSVETPSDFDGVVYVPFEGNGWKLEIAKELSHLGFEIDTNALLR